MDFKFPTSMPMLFTSPEVEESENDESRVKFQDLPLELHVKILSLIDLTDVLAYSTTCKIFYRNSNSQQLWKLQWIKFSQKTPFTFLPAQSMTDLGVNFKDSCRRLWKILVSDTMTFGGLNPAKCPICRDFTCSPNCIEERRGLKATIDIGGKMTRIITANFSQESHCSMVAIPKILKCYDCDKTFSRDEDFCDCKQTPYGGASGAYSMDYCHNLGSNVSSHTGLEYQSQALSQLGDDQAFCIFCDNVKMHQLLCERKHVVSHNQRLEEGFRMQYKMESEDDDFRHQGKSAFLPALTSVYCKDTSDILNTENLDLLCPLMAMEHLEALPIVKSYLSHIMLKFNLVEFVQHPNNALILTMPTKLPYKMKESLLKYFFEEAKAARVCLLPKPLAIAQLYHVHTCIVVDSGATSTSIWVVIDGKVDDFRSNTINVGGWHLSQCLKQSIEHTIDCDITASSLDVSAVKQRCRLSLNLSREHAVAETFSVKSQSDQNRPYDGKLDQLEVTFSSELFIGPEMMYSSLDLPARVAEATRDLPDHILKDCFSNIFITGGNTDLRGFDKRFSRDLRELLPEHSPIINVRNEPTGNHSWNTALGAYSAPVPIPYENILNVEDPGRALWMTREEYITFGTQTLAITDDLLDEDG